MDYDGKRNASEWGVGLMVHISTIANALIASFAVVYGTIFEPFFWVCVVFLTFFGHMMWELVAYTYGPLFPRLSSNNLESYSGSYRGRY